MNGSRGAESAGMLRRLSYWVSTLLLVLWLLAGAGFDLTHAAGALAILRTLGYPAYLSTMLGVCKLLAVPALLYPRAGRLREWAYAGVAFDGLGAAYSHLAIHDTAGATLAPIVFLVFAAMSYWMRRAVHQAESSPAFDAAA